MSTLANTLRNVWLWMLEPPWHHTGEPDYKSSHWLFWMVGWGWAVAGLVLGAFIAQPFLEVVGLSNVPYRDAVDIGLALVVGFLVQLVGVCFLVPATLINVHMYESTKSERDAFHNIVGRHNVDHAISGGDFATFVLLWPKVVATQCLLVLILVLALLLPLAAVAYGIYRYLTWVGSGQRLVTVAFVGGLLVKTFLIPLIKNIVSGAALTWVISKLRGDKPKPRGA